MPMRTCACQGMEVHPPMTFTDLPISSCDMRSFWEGPRDPLGRFSCPCNAQNYCSKMRDQNLTMERVTIGRFRCEAGPCFVASRMSGFWNESAHGPPLEPRGCLLQNIMAAAGEIRVPCSSSYQKWPKAFVDWTRDNRGILDAPNSLAGLKYCTTQASPTRTIDPRHR